MKQERNEFIIRIVTLMTIGYTIYYLVWRFSTFNPDAIWLSWIFWVTELYGFIIFLCFAFITWKIVNPRIQNSKYNFSVDIFVPTYGEPLDILHATISGCNKITYPHKTYILDDSGRKEVESLVKKLGCRYIARPTHEGAKAGNINYALKRSSGDLIIILDADFIPLPNILDVSMGFFNDDKVAIVQGPQIFYNLDSFQHEYSHWHEQELFYKVLQSGKNKTKSAFWCGSPSVVRRNALEDVGGVVEESVTEDIHTTIRLIGKGYHVMFVNRPLAVGIAPATLEDFLGQRFRWAQGSMQILRSKDNPLWAKGLSITQRISFLTSMGTYFDSFQKLIYLLLPIISLTTSLFPIKEFGLPFLYRFLPYMVLGVVANTVLGRGFYSFWLIEQYNVLKMFTFIKATGTLFTGKAQKFKVTKKEAGASEKSISTKLILPQIILLSITVIAIASAILIFILVPISLKYTQSELIILIIWAIFTSGLMLLGVSKLKKISKRTRYRFLLKKALNWRISHTDNSKVEKWQNGFSANFSTTGIGLELQSNVLKIGDLIEMKIPFKRSSILGLSKNSRFNIYLNGIIIRVKEQNNQEKYRAGTLISNFKSEDDRNLYFEMLHQPTLLLKGENQLKKGVDIGRLSPALKGIRYVSGLQSYVSSLIRSIGK